MLKRKNKKIYGDFGKDRLSINEIPLLIDLIPSPTILINTRRGTILGINYSVTELTRYGKEDVVGGEINLLIKDHSGQNYEEGRKYEGRMAVKGKSEFPILYQIRFIQQQNDIAVITIENKYTDNQGKSSFYQKSPRIMDELSECVLSGDKDAIFKCIEASALDLFSCTKVVIYINNEEDNTFRKINSKDTSFPDSLPASEGERINNIDFWNPAKRVLTEIQRVGRKNRFSSLITIPLKGALKGFLVLIFQEDALTGGYKSEIEIFSGWMNNLTKSFENFEKIRHENNGLQKNNVVLNVFFENSNDSIVVTDRKGKIIRVNERFIKKLKYSSYELINQNINDFIQDKILLAAVFKKEEDREGSNSVVLVHDRNGNSINMEIKIIEDYSEGEPLKIVLLSDITNEVIMSHKIDEMENWAAIGSGVAEFAHEVRNPINTISTGLQVMRRKIEGEPSSIEAIDGMQESCIRINNMMESILSLSRQAKITYKPVKICSLAERIHKRFYNKLQRFHINSQLICKNKELLVLGDIHSLDQVFTNLINNSIDAMKNEGGDLVIKIQENTEKDEYIQIIISDTGYGIPEEIANRLFEPFSTGKEKGTGLGLSITKRIVEAQRGNISVKSFTSGTIFTLNLIKATQEK